MCAVIRRSGTAFLADLYVSDQGWTYSDHSPWHAQEDQTSRRMGRSLERQVSPPPLPRSPLSPLRTLSKRLPVVPRAHLLLRLVRMHE